MNTELGWGSVQQRIKCLGLSLFHKINLFETWLLIRNCMTKVDYNKTYLIRSKGGYFPYPLYSHRFKNSIFPYVTNLWNNLETSIQVLPLADFKSRLKHEVKSPKICGILCFLYEFMEAQFQNVRTSVEKIHHFHLPACILAWVQSSNFLSTIMNHPVCYILITHHSTTCFSTDKIRLDQNCSNMIETCFMCVDKHLKIAPSCSSSTSRNFPPFLRHYYRIAVGINILGHQSLADFREEKKHLGKQEDWV